MAAENFSKSMPHVLAYEGGYSNHPKDPGGVTLQGVIQRVYDGYRKNRGRPQKPLTKSMLGTAEWVRECDDIYRRQYWDAVQGDKLPGGVDFVVFDGAVNSGPKQSIKWLQRALRMNNVDGVIGQATLGALDSVTDCDLLIADICAQRLRFMQALDTWSTFKKGWTSRVAAVKKTGQAWASGSVGPVPAPLDAPAPKAIIEDAKKAPPRAPGDLAAGGGSATVVISQATDALTPLASMSEKIGYIVAGLTVLGVLLAVGGIAYRSWASSRAADLKEALS